MPERLPPNPFNSFSDEHAAYESCLNLEAAGASLLKPQSCSTVQIHPRSPGLRSPSKGFLARDISSCDDNAEFLAGLSYLYVMGVIGTFRNPKGPGAIPTPQSDHSLGPLQDNVEALLSQPTANAEKLALAGDHYRCIFGWGEERRRNTILAHIFGQSTTDNIVVGGLTDAAQRKLAWATSSTDVVGRFTCISAIQELNIHRAENTFTISPEFHGPFDELQFSLHSVGPDTYEIHTYPSDLNAEYGLPDRVTLKDATCGKIPLPSRRYFQLHDACASFGGGRGCGTAIPGFGRRTGLWRVPLPFVFGTLITFGGGTEAGGHC
ncbi:hypothetical protein ARMSODRAFT_1081732 [Armillaria solidipes]|uniref:Uncharacterized protein n=1 Tax=Armillaria solidipes TaxID=1076256 RepID=A0A2H3BX38_9AGAR|nr:hypothetical protein ARMSODRAFT_1081732 [Armillaria solidipes]